MPGLEVVDFTEKGLEVKFLSLDYYSWDIPLDDAMWSCCSSAFEPLMYDRLLVDGPPPYKVDWPATL